MGTKLTTGHTTTSSPLPARHEAVLSHAKAAILTLLESPYPRNRHLAIAVVTILDSEADRLPKPSPT